MKTLEHNLQKSCIRWFDLQYPQYKMLLFAIPNGGHRNKATAGRLKAEGVRAGVADLFFAYPHYEGINVRHGLFIEMKISKGRQSKYQKEFESKIINQQYKYEIVISFDQFKNMIQTVIENETI